VSVGYYSPGWPLAACPNGIVAYIAAIAPALDAMGHKATVFTQQVAPGTSLDDSVYDIQQVLASRSVARRVLDGLWYRVSPRSASRHISRRCLLTAIERAVAERGIQIIDMEESFGWARQVREGTSVPICVRLHGPWFLNGKALGVAADDEFHERVRQEGLAIRAADAVTAPSHDVLKQVREFYGIALPDAAVIPPPTWPVPVAERWRLEDCDHKQILFIGRFDRHKGGDLIVDAFRCVLEAVPDARLRFVGSDPGYTGDDGRTWKIEDYVRDRIPDALETGRVEWMNSQPYSTLAQLRRRAMVTVVCSRYETFALTMVEAMALGCPTVAANAGAMPEILQDGVNGLLHRAGDPDEIAARIVQLLNNPAQAAQLGRQAAADCELRFYPEVVARQMVDFYRRVLSKQASLPRNQGDGIRP
jgi:glycosyltransferase involved in cell wall biosynthesis